MLVAASDNRARGRVMGRRQCWDIEFGSDYGEGAQQSGSWGRAIGTPPRGVTQPFGVWASGNTTPGLFVILYRCDEVCSCRSRGSPDELVWSYSASGLPIDADRTGAIGIGSVSTGVSVAVEQNSSACPGVRDFVHRLAQRNPCCFSDGSTAGGRSASGRVPCAGVRTGTRD